MVVHSPRNKFMSFIDIGWFAGRQDHTRNSCYAITDQNVKFLEMLISMVFQKKKKVLFVFSGLFLLHNYAHALFKTSQTVVTDKIPGFFSPLVLATGLK